MGGHHTEREQLAILNALSSGRWVKGPALAATCGVTERVIRHVAETTGTLISGSRGYKRVDRAKPAEILHNVAGLRSRSAKLLARANAIEEQVNSKKSDADQTKGDK